MPPKKRFANNLKIGLGQLELAFLEYFRATMGGAYGDHVRLALRYYAKHNPNMNDRLFRISLVKMLPKLKRAERESFLAEVEHFFAKDVEIPTTKFLDSIGIQLPFKGEFDSSELALDEAED